MRTTTLAVLGVFLMTTACSKPDVTTSPEYSALHRRLDAAKAELDDAKDELSGKKNEIAALKGSVGALKAVLATTQSRVRELEADRQAAEASTAEEDEVRSAFADFVAIALKEVTALSDEDAGCVATAIVDSADARSAFPVLIEMTDEDVPTAEQLDAMYAMAQAFASCGLDYANLPSATS